MVGDQSQVVVAFLPADLVHSDVDQPVQPVAVQFVGGDPLADPSDGVPVQAQEPANGALVGRGGQERGHVLQVAGEPAAVPGKGHRLGHHPVGGAVQAAQPSPDLYLPHAQVQTPPHGGHLPGVIAPPGAVPTVWATQMASAPPG
jgi:hypothetical protein